MAFVRHLIFASLLLSTSTMAAAAPLADGRWVLRATGLPILLLELRKDPAAKGGWTGRLTRPKHFEAGSNFSVFSNVEGPAINEMVIFSVPRADEVELTVENTKGERTALVWKPSDHGAGTLKYRDFPIDALPLAPARSDEQVPNEWDKARTYVVWADWPDNPEMSRMFVADQAVRENLATFDPAAIGKQDAERRARSKQLLDSGELRSGTDFYRAAFIFQHGSTPDDFLLAHTLAVIAAARGRPDATWIASATLDRYLQKIGQRQIYGTQFQLPKDAPATQEPYDRSLVSDALRSALGVPSLAAQGEQRKAWDAERAKTPPASPRKP
jgi:hypothetical protein